MRPLIKSPAILAIFLLAAPIVFPACGGDGDENGDDGNGDGNGGYTTPLDPDVDPITEGSWYRPDVDTTWQWQLLETVNTGYDVEVYDIDLFDSSTTLIAQLQGEGKKVICYFSAGSSEDWRDDFPRFEAADIGKQLDEWEGENWIDVRSENIHDIMLDRLDTAVEKGCDGVEPDNVDGYANDTGFPLTYDDQLAFNRFLANAAHERGLSVGLKNDGGQAEDLVEYFDFELNEECHQYEECGEYDCFIEAGKPVFNAEYAETLTEAQSLEATLCPQAQDENIRTLILPLDLDDSFRISCDE